MKPQDVVQIYVNDFITVFRKFPVKTSVHFSKLLECYSPATSEKKLYLSYKSTFLSANPTDSSVEQIAWENMKRKIFVRLENNQVASNNKLLQSPLTALQYISYHDAQEIQQSTIIATHRVSTTLKQSKTYGPTTSFPRTCINSRSTKTIITSRLLANSNSSAVGLTSSKIQNSDIQSNSNQISVSSQVTNRLMEVPKMAYIETNRVNYDCVLGLHSWLCMWYSQLLTLWTSEYRDCYRSEKSRRRGFMRTLLLVAALAISIGGSQVEGQLSYRYIIL